MAPTPCRRVSRKSAVDTEADHGALLALLINTETDEGEEFLDFSYAECSEQLRAILPMKGVLLASCGVLKAVVGQEVSFSVFRSVNGDDSYKAFGVGDWHALRAFLLHPSLVPRMHV